MADLPRHILLLQGPPGPLFVLLAERLNTLGVATSRININGGDRADWPGPATNYRGTLSRWALFIDRYLCSHGVTDIILYGDCRPYHETARQIATSRGVRVLVLEEGYVRPDWMTFELAGVNANSSLPRDPQRLRSVAERLPPVVASPPITASFGRRARDSFRYYAHIWFGQFTFPFYRSHRRIGILYEGVAWGWRLLRTKRHAHRTERELASLDGTPHFLVPLQLTSDYQIRLHSPFADMAGAAEFIVASFAARGAPAHHLLLKVHPLDVSGINWSKLCRQWGRRHGLEGRLHVVDGGNLETMITASRGMVCVNSTSATLALAAGKPVCAIGEAIYDIAGLTHRGHLDDFWANPTPPDRSLYEAFRRVLVHTCLVRGGTASLSATQTLLDSLIARLLARPSAIVEPGVDSREMLVPAGRDIARQAR